MRTPVFAAALLLSSLIAPSAAAADVLITPYALFTFAPNAPIDAPLMLPTGHDAFKERLGIGVSAAVLGAAGLGVELDLAVVPNFVGDDGDLVAGNVELSSRATTVMGNLIWVARTGTGARPYVVAGAGLAHNRWRFRAIDPAPGFSDGPTWTRSNLAANLGGGLLIGSGPVALRADVRWFRYMSGSDDDNGLEGSRFWRAGAGVTLGF